MVGGAYSFTDDFAAMIMAARAHWFENEERNEVTSGEVETIDPVKDD